MDRSEYVRGAPKFKKEGNLMLSVNSFDHYSSWADSTGAISRLNRIACLFVVILHRKYSQRHNKEFFYFRLNCCAGYMYEENESRCISKYIHKHAIHFTNALNVMLASRAMS